MIEHIPVRQIHGEPKRRWFSSKEFDLIVWYNPDDSFDGFELCYDKQHFERSIVWRPASGFVHMAIDDGEQRPGRFKSSPVLVADGLFDATHIYREFAQECTFLPQEIAEYVLQAIKNHPAFSAAPQPAIPAGGL